jgi:hypothetical protein
MIDSQYMADMDKGLHALQKEQPMVVTFDIETLTWFDDLPALPREAQLMMMQFGLAVAVLNDEYGNVETRTYGIGQDRPARDLWSLLCKADQIVTFNGLKFDLPISYLEAMFDEGVHLPWPQARQIDLFDSINRATGRWYSLNDLALATLGREKSADGRKAAQWLKSGEPALIAECVDYCRLDVELTRALWLHACGEQKPLILPAREKKREAHGYRLWLDLDGEPVRMEWM